MTTGALAYLTWHTVLNRLRQQISRLRSPRYAIALLLGMAWITAVLWQRSAPGGQPHTGGPWVELIAAFSILILVAWSWLSSPDARVLTFSPAEVTLLFPAPVSRLTLLHYKLLRTQLVILVNVVIWTALASQQQAGLPVWLRAASFWVVITTLALHRLAAAMVRSSVSEHGRFGLRRRVVSVGLATAALAALAVGLWDVWPGLAVAARSGDHALREALARAINHPAIATVLWPLRALVHPLGATSPSDWLGAMVPAVGILLVHYLWVVRSDVAFEEAATEASLARARRTTTPSVGVLLTRGGSRNVSPPLFPLSPTGRPGTAILWKSLAAVLRRRRALQTGLVLAVLGPIVATATQGPRSTIAEVTGTLTLTWLGFLVVLGPQWVRNDLRGDLPKVDLLRSYPLRGRTIVAMEASASAVALTLLEFALGALAFLAFLNVDIPEMGSQDRGLLVVAVVLLLPPLNLMAMLLQNGAAVLFPGWVRGAPAKGVEALGQQFLSVTALWLVLAFTLVVPVGLAAITFRALKITAGAWALAPAFGVWLAVLGAEAWALVRWLGAVFERAES